MGLRRPDRRPPAPNRNHWPQLPPIQAFIRHANSHRRLDRLPRPPLLDGAHVVQHTCIRWQLLVRKKGDSGNVVHRSGVAPALGTGPAAQYYEQGRARNGTGSLQGQGVGRGHCQSQTTR